MKILVGPKELCFYQILQNYKVTPAVVSFKQKQNDVYQVELSASGFKPINQLKTIDKKLRKAVDDKIKRLHTLGIVHGRLTSYDVLVNAKGEVRLVGFSDAKFINQLTSVDLKKYRALMGQNFKTKNDLLGLERIFYLL